MMGLHLGITYNSLYLSLPRLAPAKSKQVMLHCSSRCEALDAVLLPPLWLVHTADASDSGRVHSDVRRR